MTSKVLLLSIRPKFAEKIFNGSKKIELRRIRPNLSENDIVVVYVSSPIKQIQGTFTVEKIIEKPLNELWPLVQYDAGISKKEFDEYFTGVDYGYGIYIRDIANNYQPIDLCEIRKQWGGFNPPQSYRYLSQSELNLFYSFT